MTKIEKKVLLKMIQMQKEMQDKLDYICEACELLVKIETERINRGKK